MELNSSSSSSFSQCVAPTQLTQRQISRQEVVCKKRVTSREYFRFDGELSWAVSNSIKTFYNDQYTCLSNLAPEELQLWWRTFECTWPPELNEEVKDGWLKRTEGANAVASHYQGLISASQFARKMEGKTPIPSALFARSHSKEDALSANVFIDDRKDFEALRVDSSMEAGSQEAEKLYYEISGVRNPPSIVWTLVLTCFTRNQTTFTTSIGSISIPLTNSKLVADMKSTQQQLNEQRSLLMIRSSNLMW
ncbi:LOW QUALITY PROTEIN: hypothetical protein Cgig2_000622 [Carnegiea gigantea]|uniref:Uncharacterized protein n=1 Tax=Carnegiea gigantea TaxID=171969 RepID=A0A9Q1KE49_9CARY|nr:LOW QUALITY PROTEIN: hypothetical protein Cgig2_000622 [Carnegiea gigantea]